MNRKPDMQRVSDAYRGIANETTRPEIDDRIMAMARREARTPYGLARAWVRPVAWAATIALSLAFILEVTYFGDDTLPADAVAPAAEIAAPEVKARDVAPLREAEERSDAASAAFADEAPAPTAAKSLAPSGIEEDERHCDAEARQNAASWHRCVLALRDQGLHEAAKVEFEALLEAYPDFREPLPE